MKTRLFFSYFIFFLFSYQAIFSQVMYVTDREYDADYIVQIVEQPYSADLFVYQTDRVYDARQSNNDGIWFITNRENEADYNIYINTQGKGSRSLGAQDGDIIGLGSNNTRNVDFKIYLVANKNQAGKPY